MRGRARLLKAALLLHAAPAACADLARLHSPTLTITEAVQEGTLCRVAAVARPRPAARIGIEIWLPPAARWSGRYYQMGNGGFAGHVDRPTLAAAAARGDVAAATDTGHTGNGFEAGWAIGRRDLVEDYAWRSIRITSDAARVLTRAYYGQDARRRYFMGCSYGGRQALVAAARWPGDWDGVIAGAPATRWTVRQRGFAAIHAALARPGAWIEAAQLATIIARHDTSGLTPAQRGGVAAIERAGYPLRHASAAAWGQWIYNRDAATGTQAAFVAQAPSLWDAATPPAWAERLFAVGPLRAFAARGGRVLSYFGTADPVLPSGFAVSDARSAGARAGFYRLFMVPGMEHCQGGDAPHAIGQSLPAPTGADDAEHDVRRALEAWVERGRAPARLIATRPGDATQMVVLSPARL
ncbi:tannase/feruloyl esterase family alpha/beta hydrolase [Sphingomonas sp.]|uniref:tannase/feruloyl esterase family alpha/beta hydrolase n=1 Tax=Sphingomonas sp. TaxID=28214 RepID=UPI003CC51760